MDALLIAGGLPQEDEPLYPVTGGTSKALLDIGGKPMAQWVLDAVDGSQFIENVVLVGPEQLHHFSCSKPIAFLPDAGGMLANARAGLNKIREIHPQAEHALVLSCDVPAVTAAMLDWRINDALQHDSDLDYAVITQQSMEARFPGANRSYIKLRDIVVCGGDVNVVRVSLGTEDQIWSKLIEARKSIFKQAALVGYDTLLLLLTRMMTLAGAEKIVCERLGIKGRVSVAPYAELAMDVDKPHQLEILRQDLAGSV